MSVVLQAEKREKLGSSEANRIKRSGRIPAVIYSKNGNINLSVNAKEFGHEYLKGTSLTTIFELDFDGKKVKAIAHKVDIDPVSDHPVHIDFFNCDELKVFRAQPKVAFVNQDKSPGIKRGGFLHVVLRKVEVSCESKDQAAIPEKIEVDIGAMHVGTKIRANNLKLPEGVSFVKKGNFLIASIIGRGKSDEAAATTADGAAAPAAGGAAAPAAKAEAGKAAEKKPADKK